VNKANVKTGKCENMKMKIEIICLFTDNILRRPESPGARMK